MSGHRNASDGPPEASQSHGNMDGTMKDSRSTVRWPVVTLDFEASSLSDRSYPIEVGVARWSAPDAPIMTWSSLIRPSPDWKRSGDWSKESEKVHGIAQSELDEGMLPRLALAKLDDIVGDALAFCDGGINDSFWMRRLSQAAGRSPDFALGDLDGLMINLPTDMQSRAERWLSQNRVVHRAGEDALRHMHMIASALDVRPGPSIPIHI